jgi:hypothetical protein
MEQKAKRGLSRLEKTCSFDSSYSNSRFNSKKSMRILTFAAATAAPIATAAACV